MLVDVLLVWVRVVQLVYQRLVFPGQGMLRNQGRATHRKSIWPDCAPEPRFWLLAASPSAHGLEWLIAVKSREVVVLSIQES